ncbi:hypothetical protein AWB72_05314 [Caballeronia concitans]|uniref:Uncharacterized protein n=1 Tax=Caballeronia concitans TaxID=1777133 RepID=A0A658R5C0_9BURK|nr:hypothetical protein AWB72_05314 [Caballeronia concitans]
MKLEFHEHNAVETAIEECQRQIAAQTDRVTQQTKAGRAASTSRYLLFALHRSLEALKRAEQF